MQASRRAPRHLRRASGRSRSTRPATSSCACVIPAPCTLRDALKTLRPRLEGSFIASRGDLYSGRCGRRRVARPRRFSRRCSFGVHAHVALDVEGASAASTRSLLRIDRCGPGCVAAAARLLVQAPANGCRGRGIGIAGTVAGRSARAARAVTAFGAGGCIHEHVLESTEKHARLVPLLMGAIVGPVVQRNPDNQPASGSSSSGAGVSVGGSSSMPAARFIIDTM